MRIEKIMTPDPVSVGMDDSLAEVKAIFDSTRFHHLLVVEENKLVGVISDRDLLRSLSPAVGTAAETARDAALLNKRAHQIMSRKLVTLPPDAGIYQAVELFRDKVSCIPVVQDNNQPVGILSWRDLMRVLKPKPHTEKD